MNFTEACSLVVEAIKRPDKINRVRNKVNAAISFFVLDNEFALDYKEQAITLDATQYTQSFDISTMTRFRKFDYLKNGGTKIFLKHISDSERLSCSDWRNRWYQAGTAVNIYLSALASTLDVGYYQYPALLTDVSGFNTHWLLDVAPFMVVDRAIADMFREIGDEKSFQAIRASSTEQYMAMRKDLGTATK
jgi:hypothetical protein